MSWIPPLLNVVLLLTGIFLILLILIQRGKGGGLAGAFGGTGGSSAFGSRAGDAFTRVTIMVAAVWILLIMIMIRITQPPAQSEVANTVAPNGPANTAPESPAPASGGVPPASPEMPPAIPAPEDGNK